MVCYWYVQAMIKCAKNEYSRFVGQRLHTPVVVYYTYNLYVQTHTSCSFVGQRLRLKNEPKLYNYICKHWNLVQKLLK